MFWGVMSGGVFQTLFWGWFLEGFGVTRHAKTLIPCDRGSKLQEICDL